MAPPVKLPTRKLGKNGPEITAIGFGLMGLSTAYGSVGSDEERLKVLDSAWELGCTNWDSADMYADSEDLLGKWFALHPERRADIFLATKFGLRPGVREDGSRGLLIDSSPAYCRQQCVNSLKRLGVDSIDLYYIHRVDGKTPIEKTMQELVKLKQEGKIKHIGISACSAATLRRACAVAQVDAYQVEYSPWALDIEGPESNYLLQTCRELGVSVFAYAPLGRGIMTGQIKSLDDFEPGDLRRLFPRFSRENFPKNLALVDKFKEMAARKGCTPGQLTIAWLMAQGEDVVPIPGTKNIKYLEENLGAVHVAVSEEEEREIRGWIEEVGIAGIRVPPGLLDEFNDTPPLQ
ncbi:NADP-dependent oxidoreductase domain-containing protein [Achaetomium macrosporum]|uniref:NADP-dependent oxidoreductase domain-containing protein n=1 Tax=Achaetomium macrosporum TaxID=79813 RepID=A0AAN7C902_9PEZI|nr:NADP-dependent oxidoreductase domain-containing protein [Achaetomium macrosporum]